jgi:hypothetical protein
MKKERQQYIFDISSFNTYPLLPPGLIMQKHGVNEEYIDKDQFYYISMLTYKAKGRKKKLMYIYIYSHREREREHQQKD